MSDEMKQDATKCNMLTPSQRVFAMFRARGRSVADAAKEAGVTRTTPAAHWDMDLINGAILEIQQQMIASPVEAIGPLVPVAVEQLAKALATGSFAAIQETFDRAWGKPTQRQVHTGDAAQPVVVKVLRGAASMGDL